MLKFRKMLSYLKRSRVRMLTSTSKSLMLNSESRRKTLVLLRSKRLRLWRFKLKRLSSKLLKSQLRNQRRLRKRLLSRSLRKVSRRNLLSKRRLKSKLEYLTRSKPKLKLLISKSIFLCLNSQRKISKE